MASDLQCFQIEDHDLGRVAVADEPAIQIRDHSHAVTTLQARDGTYFGAAISIEHSHFCSVREIDPPRGCVEGDVVKIFASTLGCAERDFLEQVVAGFFLESENCCAEQNEQDD